MASAGTVTVDLLARTGSFTTDIDRATKQAEQRMMDFKKTVVAVFAGNQLSGIVDQVVGRISSLAHEVLEGVDALNDVADATGASIENISALEDVVMRTGGSMNTATSMLIKFNAQLSGVDEDNKASKVIKAIGLNIEDLRKLDPVEALHKLAQALDGFADDQNKATIIQQIFAKSVREAAPVLHDLAEQEKLVGTVSVEQAKQVEEFNKALARSHKNTLDLARYLSQDLIEGINAAVDALHKSGLSEAIFTLFTGTDKYKLQKQLFNLTDDLLTQENELQRLRAGPANKQHLETQAAIVKGIQQQIDKTQQLLKLTEPDFFKGTAPPKPSAPRVDTRKDKEDKDKKGKDPDKDFEQYIKNLQRQIDKTEELTEVQKLNLEIRRGYLTVSPAQYIQLEALAQTIDKEKEHKKVLEEKRAAFVAGVDDYVRGIEEYRKRLDSLLSGTPSEVLRKQREDMEFLTEALTRGPEHGGITEAQYLEAVTKRLNLVADKATETKSIMEELGNTFASSAESALFAGGKFSDAFKQMGEEIARVIFRLGVMEPALKRLKEAMSGSLGGGGGNWFENLLQLGGRLLGSALGGGAPSVDFSAPGASDISFSNFAPGGAGVVPGAGYIVGDAGRRELFVPTVSGRVVPVDDSRAGMVGGGEVNLHLINQTQGTVDRVVPQRLSDRDMVFILQQTRRMVVGEMGNRNSDIHRATTAALQVRARMG